MEQIINSIISNVSLMLEVQELLCFVEFNCYLTHHKFITCEFKFFIDL